MKTLNFAFETNWPLDATSAPLPPTAAARRRIQSNPVGFFLNDQTTPFLMHSIFTFEIMSLTMKYEIHIIRNDKR